MERLQLAEEEGAFIRRTRQALEEARAGRKKRAYGTDGYWKYLKLEVQQEGVLATVAWHIRGKGMSSSSDSFKEAKSEYLYQQQRREGRRKAIEEKQRVFRKRNRIVSLSSRPDTLAAARVAYVDLLLSIERKIPHPAEQFSKNVVGRYSSVRRQPRRTRSCWCAVSGKCVHRVLVGATHIFPRSLGQMCMSYIFGLEAEGELNSSRNGLLLPTSLVEKFRDHRVTLVPADCDTNLCEPREWKVLVIDRPRLWNRSADSVQKYGDIHGRRLLFVNHFRPRARYLYFHYLCSMATQFRRDRITGVVRGESEMLELTRAWGKHGRRYLRDSVIAGFIDELGQEIPVELKESILSHASSQKEVQGEAVDSLANLDTGDDNDSNCGCEKDDDPEHAFYG